MEKLLSLLLFLMLLCIPQEAGASEIAFAFDAALAAKKLNGVTDVEYGRLFSCWHLHLAGHSLGK